MDIYRRLKHVRTCFWLLLGISVITLGLLLVYRPNYYQTSSLNQEKAPLVTLNTTRLPGKDAVEAAISIAQNIYPATFKDNKPNAVILVPVSDWRAALLASEIIHFPINAPILYTHTDSIPTATLQEIRRLDPEGIFPDGNTRVLIIGTVSQQVKDSLEKEKLQYRVLQADSPEELASLLDDYKAMFHIDHDDEVIIAPLNSPGHAVIAASWVAHMGHSIFFVDETGLSPSLRQSLSRRPQQAYMYVLGDVNTIPEKVTRQLSQYGHVQRIPGTDVYEMSVGFAGYKDVGPNLGWWIGRQTRSFGWGVSEAGHNFTFVNPEQPELAIPAAALSHMGKHGPFLLVKRDEVPLPVMRFLETVQPGYTSSQEALFNYGWIIGEADSIDSNTQQSIDKLLQIKRQL